MRTGTRLCSLGVLAAVLMAVLGGGTAWGVVASTFYVNSATGSDANDCLSATVGVPPVGPCLTINGAIGKALTGDTIIVAAGTYSEAVVLGKGLILQGAQVGVAACGRSAGESIVSGASGTLLTLLTGSAGSIIDGFTFSGGARGIESSSGPLTGLQILNNRVVGFTGNGVFLNDSGLDITVHQNLIDGTSKTGGGGLFHLDTDNFDGFHFTDNCVQNGTTGTGFFVDGNRNVGASAARSPLFSGNLIQNNLTGVNLGSRAIEDATISGNSFSANLFDGLQGGPKNTLISQNTFAGNGRSGLAFTSFGNLAADRGAQFNSVTLNCFTGNGFSAAGEAVFFSASQAVGTIATNLLNQNNIEGNNVGVRYGGAETINAESNWWGAASGPSGTGPGTGDSVVGATVDFTPFLTAMATGTPCDPVEPPCPIEPALTDFRDVRRPNDINVGPDLGGTGHTAINFTGSAGAAGDTWSTVYDETPGTPDQTNFTGSINLSADVLSHAFNNKKGAGLLALYNEASGKKGLALIIYNNGNSDSLALVTLNHQTGKLVVLKTMSLGSAIGQNQWYRLNMDVAVTGLAVTVTGSVDRHSVPTDPDSDLGPQVGGVLTFTGTLGSGSLAGVDATGEVGIMASATSATVDSSVTNFSINSSSGCTSPPVATAD